MVQKFDDVLKELNIRLKNKKILLACSTGVDSMVLFDLLTKTNSINELVIAHINHQKRLQSSLEEEYISNLCETLKIKCYVKRLEKYNGNNFQSWARDERYKFFYDIAKKEAIDVLLLAHHANDNIETIILRLIRSASLEGYAGIRTNSKYHDLDIYRPLLNVSKNDIVLYAKENNIKYFDDESNFEDDYTRNRIRHHIVPILEKENPALIKSIKNYSTTLFEASDFIENYETNFIKNKVIVNNNNELFFAKMKLEDYLSENSFLQEQILFRLLKRFSLSKDCILDIIKQLYSTKTNICQKVNNNLIMIKEYGYVVFTNDVNENNNFYLEINQEGIYVLPHNLKLEVNKNICNLITPTSKIWYNIDGLPIIIRTRKNGDKIKRKSGTVSVSDFLTNKKVPLLERRKILLLCDSNNQPVSILGYIVK